MFTNKAADGRRSPKRKAFANGVRIARPVALRIADSIYYISAMDQEEFNILAIFVAVVEELRREPFFSEDNHDKLSGNNAADFPIRCF